MVKVSKKEKRGFWAPLAWIWKAFCVKTKGIEYLSYLDKVGGKKGSF
jgi:hypothetical protein